VLSGKKDLRQTASFKKPSNEIKKSILGSANTPETKTAKIHNAYFQNAQFQKAQFFRKSPRQRSPAW
jgi:hypothetical protein